MPNARAWFCSTSFHGRLEMEMVSATPKLPVYCAPCDIEHDQPQDCPSHDDYEPVRGLDRYPEVKVSDLADND